METLLPNVNTSEGRFEIGVTISNPVFTEDAINKRKHERKRSNKICILSMLSTSDTKRMLAMNTAFALVLTVFLFPESQLILQSVFTGQCRSV